MTNFPVSLDQFNNPTSSTKTNAPGFDHAEQHTNANDAIEALQSKIGIDMSTNETSIDFKIRRLLSRHLVVEPFGVGDGVALEFPLTFKPVGDAMILDNNVRVSAVVIEPTPGVYAVVCVEPPVGVLTIVAIKETV